MFILYIFVYSLYMGFVSFGFTFAYRTLPFLEGIRRYIRNKIHEKLVDCTFCVSFWFSFFVGFFTMSDLFSIISSSLFSATVSYIIANMIYYYSREDYTKFQNDTQTDSGSE